jgi:hypothetical protein
VRYRIAYLALCIEYSDTGAWLRTALERMQDLHPVFVQFGSPDWFWERYRNSCALQVGPVRHAGKDQAVIAYDEALQVQAVRDEVFDHIRRLLKACRSRGQ